MKSLSLLATACAIALIGAPSNVLAVSITVDVGGTVDPPREDTYCLDNANGTPRDWGNGITIGKKTSTLGCPRVEVVAETGSTGKDYIALKNAKITATAPVTNFRIAFWANLISPPSSPPDVAYTWTATGTLAGNGNSSTFKGWLQDPASNPTSGTYLCTNSSGTSDPASCGKTYTFAVPGVINLSDQGPGTGKTISGSRYVKGEVIFTLNTTGKALQVTSFAIQDTSAGECDPEEDVCKGQLKPKKKSGGKKGHR